MMCIEPEDRLDAVWEKFNKNDYELKDFLEETFNLSYEQALHACIGFRKHVEQIVKTMNV